MTNQPVTPEAERVDIGAPAPDVPLTTISGDRIHLTDFKGRKNVMLYFMRAFTCMQCRQFARRLAEVAPELGDTQVMIVGPGLKRDAERLAQAIDPKNRTLVVYDGNGDTYDAFALNKVFFSLVQKSAAFIIDKNGVLRYAAVSANPNRWLSGDSLEALKRELAAL